MVTVGEFPATCQQANFIRSCLNFCPALEGSNVEKKIPGIPSRQFSDRVWIPWKLTGGSPLQPVYVANYFLPRLYFSASPSLWKFSKYFIVTFICLLFSCNLVAKLVIHSSICSSFLFLSIFLPVKSFFSFFHLFFQISSSRSCLFHSSLSLFQPLPIKYFSFSFFQVFLSIFLQLRNDNFLFLSFFFSISFSTKSLLKYFVLFLFISSQIFFSYSFVRKVAIHLSVLFFPLCWHPLLNVPFSFHLFVPSILSLQFRCEDGRNSSFCFSSFHFHRVQAAVLFYNFQMLFRATWAHAGSIAWMKGLP